MARNSKTAAPNNIYTAMLALAVGIVLVTAAFVLYTNYTDYGVFFSLP